MGQTDLGAGFQALAANVAQAARHCFALAVAMRRSEQRLALPLRARLDKRRNAGISEIRAAAERQAYFGCPRCGVWDGDIAPLKPRHRSEEHTSELQSLMRISYAVFCLKQKKNTHTT